MKSFILSFILFMFLGSLSAQDTLETSPLVFIYDASGSMWGKMESKTKMEIAAQVLTQSVEQLAADQKVGLVAYGHRRKGDCEDVEFLVDMNNEDKSMVTKSLQGIKPLGKTPLAYSALQVIDRLRQSKSKATIILITDGIESCGGNICEVIKKAKEEGIDFKLHIIGFGLKPEDTEQLKCAAEAGEGNYYDAADADGLSEVLTQATSTTVDESDPNFSVYAVKNGKPIDAYIKAYTDQPKDAVAAARTYEDTAFFHLPKGTFNLAIKPLGGSDVDAIILSGVKIFNDTMMHRTVSFDAGKIEVNTLNNGEGWDAVVKIFPKGGEKPVASGRTYGRKDLYDLNPGSYEVKVKALGMKGSEITWRFDSVEVKANEVTPVEHNFETGVVMIGATSSTGLVDAVVKIIDPDSGKTVASGRTYTHAKNNPKKFVLTTGTYDVSLKALKEHKGKEEKISITVKGGETVEKVVGF